MNDMNILFEDENIIVIVKPYGVASQMERGSAADMVSILMNYFHNNGEKNPYVGVVHRLDKTVGGVMVYGKNKQSTGKLCSMISGQDVTKRYYAIVYNGSSLEKEGILEDMLLRDSRVNMSRVVKPKDKGYADAKKACLEYKVLFTKNVQEHELTAVDIKLLTGRHHQIRVQFAARGCPLVGDRKYGQNVMENPIYTQYVGLFCHTLEFKHPVTGKKMTFTAKPDKGIFEKMPL